MEYGDESGDYGDGHTEVFISPSAKKASPRIKIVRENIDESSLQASHLFRPTPYGKKKVAFVEPDGHVPAKVVLYDEEYELRDDDSVVLDPRMNPEEELMDPVTMYRFAENSRRLDRLRAELNGKSITPGPTLPSVRNFHRDRPTLDPSEAKLPAKLRLISSRGENILSRGPTSRGSSASFRDF